MADVERIELPEPTVSDERGWRITPLEAADVVGASLGDLHVVSLRPGIIRGNHYHANDTEWLLIWGGPAELAWRSRGEDSIQKTVVGETEPALFKIPRNVEHAVLNICQGDIYVLSFNDAYERGTVSCPSLF